MKYDIFCVGVGGQGILTIGEVLAEVAKTIDMPANFYPSKGMAQRGGFVKAQLRLGRINIGPNIPQRSADMVVSMELSESLKAVPFIKPGGHFVIYGDIWAPTAVALGKAPYPTFEQVKEHIESAGAKLVYMNPADLPIFEGEPVRPNLYVLGVLIGQTDLGQYIKPEQVEAVIQTRFKRFVEANLFAFRAGLSVAQAT